MKPATVPVELTVNFAGDGIVLKSGDTLLLTFREALSTEEAVRIKDRLAEFAPDVNLAIVDQVSGVAVQRAEEESCPSTP